jgi:hypothetical protein
MKAERILNGPAMAMHRPKEGTPTTEAERLPDLSIQRLHTAALIGAMEATVGQLMTAEVEAGSTLNAMLDAAPKGPTAAPLRQLIRIARAQVCDRLATYDLLQMLEELKRRGAQCPSHAETETEDPEEEAPTEADKWSGLTDEHVRQVLARIASVASDARDLCTTARCTAPDDFNANAPAMFASLLSMVSQVGCLADLPIGGEVVGHVGDWFIGHPFREANHAAC